MDPDLGSRLRRMGRLAGDPGGDTGASADYDRDQERQPVPADRLEDADPVVPVGVWMWVSVCRRRLVSRFVLRVLVVSRFVLRVLVVSRFVLRVLVVSRFVLRVLVVSRFVLGVRVVSRFVRVVSRFVPGVLVVSRFVLGVLVVSDGLRGCLPLVLAFLASSACSSSGLKPGGPSLTGPGRRARREPSAGGSSRRSIATSWPRTGSQVSPSHSQGFARNQESARFR